MEIAAAVAIGSSLGCREEAPRAPDPAVSAAAAPRVSVTVRYAGAAPDEVERVVVKPIEAALGALDGVDGVRSASWDGAGEVRVTFRVEVDAADALARVRAALGGVARSLPSDADMPVVRRLGDAQRWVVVDMPSADPELAHRLADMLAADLASLPGVLAVERCGGAPELAVTLDPAKLAAYGLTARDVQAALARASIEQPAGRLEAHGQELALRSDGVRSLVDLEHVALAARGDALVRLQDVAQVARVPGPATCRVAGAAAVGVTARDVTDAQLLVRAREVLTHGPPGLDRVVVLPARTPRVEVLGPRWPDDAEAPDAPPPGAGSTVRYTIDRDAAARLGVRVDDVARAIELALGGRGVAHVTEGARQLTVRLTYGRLDPEQVLVPAARGAQVPLTAVVRASSTP